MNDLFTLKEKVAVVTGAAQGIGREIAIGFSRYGAEVVGVDLNEEKLQEVKKEIDVQKAFLLEWVTSVQLAIAKGWSKEECFERITFLDRFPVDVGQEHMGEHVTRNNISALYDKLTGPKEGKND